MKPLILLISLVMTGQVFAEQNPPQDQSQEEQHWYDNQADVKTTTEEIEVIDPEELPESFRNLPELVEKIQIERAAADNPHVLLPHRPNYVMPFTYQTRPDDREWDRLINEVSDGRQQGQEGEFEHVEAVFQISIKYVLAEGLWDKHSRLEVGYTNRSFWQAYNDKISKPFRETNHEPELMLSWRPKHIKWIEHAGLSLNHQSNGQTSSLSRSWNRLILEGASVVGKSIWVVRAWWRIPEERKGDPFDPSDNDNPDIDDYMGPGELYYLRVMDKHTLSVMARNNFNFDENRGAVQLDWSFPLTKRLKGYVQYFNGYGESLIDYNRYQERFGIGIKLSDWI
ncbi:phospholipase A [Bacterioplanoides sp.]|uniref:phospholipase A n=1 Tax=Bacterioplanoides sp. TaxID=2066072 RepID=UPI003B5C68E9